MILFTDNMGWANVGFHRPPAADPREFRTENVDALARDGVELDRHYTYKFCSPSRSALMSGRLPYHVNIYNDNPAMPGAGVPVGMTLMSEKLKSAGYSTHFVGKWHIGMASASTQIPTARGFDTSLGYFHSENDYYDMTRSQGCSSRPAVDLWDTGAPAWGLNGSLYEERLFGNRAVDLIRNHDPEATPLFLYYAFHTSCVGTHGKLQPDPQYDKNMSFIDNADRRANHAMVALMDDVVGDIVDALRTTGHWNRTLVLWSSDNGGAVHLGGGANVYPLRGGYFNNWEGGIRVAALLAGGFLPDHVRGTKLAGMIHECDWLATFCYLAGVSDVDERAAAMDPPLPPIDSLNVWPLVTGANSTSPRVEWILTPLGEDPERAEHGGDAGIMAEGRYKLLVGRVAQAGWTGQVHPNSSQPWDSFKDYHNCTHGDIGKVGCLFDVLADPGEHNDLALQMPAKANELFAKLKAAEADWFNPDRGAPNQKACDVAASTGFWGPFLP